VIFPPVCFLIFYTPYLFCLVKCSLFKAENDSLKALKMPQEDMKDGSSIRGEAQEEIERLKAQLKLSEEERNKAKEKEPVKIESKKWWQLWK
ncbi:hypothetical protein ABXL81_13435, partial [Enterococcus faecalis]